MNTLDLFGYAIDLLAVLLLALGLKGLSTVRSARSANGLAALALGLAVLLGVGLSFAWAQHYSHMSLEQTRSMVFITLLTGNAALYVSSRSQNLGWTSLWKPANWTAYTLLGSAGALVALAIYWPWLSDILKFAPLSWPAASMALAWGLLSLPAALGVKSVFAPLFK